MPDPWIVVAASVFIAFVVWRVIPWSRWLEARERDPAVRDALAKVRSAKSAAARAEALTTLAGAEAARHRVRRARALYLRAMRADRDGTAALDALVALHETAGTAARVERTLWRLMERGTQAQHARAKEHLQRLYEGALKDSPRARVVRELQRGA